jgi:hemoglobin
VHEQEPFRAEHFIRWYELWTETVDAHWAGPQAERAKSHAGRIGSTMARRLVDSPAAAPVALVRKGTTTRLAG